MKKFAVISVAVLILSLTAMAQPPVPGETGSNDVEEDQIPVPDESVEGPETQHDTVNSSEIQKNNSESTESEDVGLLKGFFKMASLFF